MKRLLSLILAATMLISVSGVYTANPIIASAATYVSENQEFSIKASDMKRPTLLKKGAKYKIKGTLKANKEISELSLVVEDLNQFKNDISVVKYPDKKSVDLSKYASALAFEKLSSGEKQLVITAVDEDGNSVVLNRKFTVLGKAKEPYHITKKCDISVSSGKVSAVTDSSDNTYWKSGKMTIEFPENKEVDGILIKWFWASSKYTLKTFDENGEELDSYSEKNYNMLNKYYPVNENAVRAEIVLKSQSGNKGMAALRVYEKDKVGVSVQRWEPAKDDECDLMLISAHRDDEVLYFGGTIPYYQNVKDKNVYVLYMSGNSRLRNREALDCLWSMGCKTYPVFMGFAGGYHDGISGTLKSWGGENAVLKKMVEKIRKYKPDVVVSHDTKGEYGHPTHKTVSYLAQKAVKQAADETKFSDSYNKYGEWQVQKLYLHMYKKNKITMTCYKQTDAKLNWKSAYQLACVGYDKHRSQHGGWSMNSSAVKKYPSNQYGLAYSTVGKDKEKNDFFVNIDIDEEITEEDSQ